MLKFIAASLVGCCGFVCSADAACNCNCACDCCAPAAVAAPAAAAPAAPTPILAGTQYRTYSYQPAPAYYPSYSPSYNRAPASGFHDAGWKVRGF
jgi:hypothetical protein